MTRFHRPTLTAVLTLALCATVGLTAAPALAKKNRNLASSQTVNAAVPDATAATSGELAVTIKAGKKFKGRKIRDVNVTVQTTGGPDAAGDLIASLSAPNGATALLFFSLAGDSVGPLTLDDESRLVLSSGSPTTSGLLLNQPYAGTAQPGNTVIGSPLAVMDDGRVRGDWTLRLFDTAPAGTNVLNSWSLDVRTGKPYKTK